MTEQLNGFAEYVEAKRQAWKVPGAAVAVIQEDEVIFAQGFGLRDVEANLPVTPETIFAIGSASKAFTAAACAIAVDDGKLDWDKPVREYVPWFQMQDLFASTRMSARDLLCHRSGLPRHDLSWYGSTDTREALIQRVRYLEANHDFRTYFQYQNFMYTTAGYLAGVVEGSSWEDVVRARIFQPLGMTSSQFSVEESKKSDNAALPYYNRHEQIVKADFRNIDAIGPAGSINSNLIDMIQWVKLHLNNGKWGDQAIVSEANMNQLHSPQMSIANTLWREIFGVSMVSYGLGWFIMPYQSEILLHHGGNIDGFSALVSFIPKRKIGMVVLTNLNSNLLTETITYDLYDRLLGTQGKDWHDYFFGLTEKMKAQAEEAKAKAASDRVAGTQPSHALDAYAGEFENPGYGVFKVSKGDDGKLRGTFNGIGMVIEHYHYDIFELNVEEFEQKLLMTFTTDTKGNVTSLSVGLEPSAKPIVFTRLPDKAMQNRAFLEPFVGKYELMGMTVTISLRGDTQLIASVPGQGDQTLEPYMDTTFTLKGLSGFSIKFVRDESGAVTEAVITQPGATVSAKRVVE